VLWDKLGPAAAFCAGAAFSMLALVMQLQRGRGGT